VPDTSRSISMQFSYDRDGTWQYAVDYGHGITECKAERRRV